MAVPISLSAAPASSRVLATHSTGRAPQGRVALVASKRLASTSSSYAAPSHSLRASVSSHRCAGPSCSRCCEPLLTTCSLDTTKPEEEKNDQGSDFSANMRVPSTGMAPNLGSGGGGSATLQRSKLDMTQKVTESKAKLDDSGGGGGIGGKIFNGGGGDGDDGDDDDYFNEGDDEGDGDGDENDFFRNPLPELYDKLSIDTVLKEWYRSVNDLPLIIRRAVEMGLLSSASIVRFCSLDVRPNVARHVTRVLPPEIARGFVGRLMADPAFCQKLVLETTLAGATTMWYEARVRGRNLTKEMDFAAINTIAMAAAAAGTVWFLAPSRSYGAVLKFPWQQMVESLPKNAFEKAGPLREYTMASRMQCVAAKLVQLSAIGAMAGFGSAGGAAALRALRRMNDPDFEPSVPVPAPNLSAGGLGAFCATLGHGRYQLVSGLDTYLFDHSKFLLPYLFCTSAARVATQWSIDELRPWFQGLPRAPRGVALAQALKQPPTVRRRKVVKRRVVRRKKSPAAAGGFEMSVSPAPSAPAAPAAV